MSPQCLHCMTFRLITHFIGKVCFEIIWHCRFWGMGLIFYINSLIHSGEKINGRVVVCWQISTIKTSQERGRNRQFERREKARKNGIKSVLAVFGCQIGKRADSQRNSGEEKAQDIVVFEMFGRGMLRRAMPLLFRVVPW